MRKLVVCNIVSLDGFYSGPGGDVMAMPFDDGFSDYNAERLEGWGPTRVVRRADAHAEVAALKESPGREILMFGSHLLWNALLANGLVDELHVMIGAGVVGEGVAVSAPRRTGPGAGSSRRRTGPS